MHAETSASRGVCGDHASSGKDSGRESPMRSCRKGPIYLHLHENVLARLGGSPTALSGAVTPRPAAYKLPADACMVKPEQVEQDPAEQHVVDEEEDLHAATLDLAQQLRLSCSRAIRHGDMREQAGSDSSKAHAFEVHLLLAEPTRRSKMTRNNACLDLGALGQRAPPCRLD